MGTDRWKLRLVIFATLVVSAFGVMLGWLQNLMSSEANEKYRSDLPVMKELAARVPGVRGEIRDRNGITLVTNKPNFEVIVNLDEVVAFYRDPRNGFLEEDENGKLEDLPMIPVRKLEDGIYREREELDIVKIVRETIIKPLEEMGLAEDFNASKLANHYRTYRGIVPWVYRSDLSFEEFSIFAEHNFNLPGMTVAARPVRLYPYGSLACHILGYTRQPDPKRINPEEREWDYLVPDSFGIYGIERTMNDELQGIPGVQRLRKDEKGRIVGEVGYEPPKQGGHVYLTIDARIQMIAERALREAKVGRGAAVVIDPNSGEVLAMASVPNYDPNKFIPSISEEMWSEYRENEADPLLNRAVRTYAPGSTYKIPIALAGCLAGISDSHHHCAGGVQYGSKFMKCWIASKGGAHGNLDLTTAIKVSCNSFFYKYGNMAGISNIVTMGGLLGLGEKSGLEIDDEAAGVLPGPKWLELNKPGYVWSPSFTANTSIGQGDVLATPLQMASVTATVANGGLVYRPQIISKVERDGEVYARPPILKHNLADEGVSRSQIELVRDGMRQVVNSPGGTARRARIEGVEVAGKTGTAQFKRKGVPDNHAWFITFAPYDRPKYAICVLIQGGKSGGGVASPVAHRIMEESLALDSGFDVAIKPLPEVKGSFEFIELIDFASSNVAHVSPAGGADEDPDTGSVVAVRESRRDTGESRSFRPTIRSEADDRGRVTNGRAGKPFSFWKRRTESRTPLRGGRLR